MEEIRSRFPDSRTPVVISGWIGPQGDGYAPEEMSADEAAEYHHIQIATLADTSVDMVTAITMTYTDEAIGIVVQQPRRDSLLQYRSPSKRTAYFRAANSGRRDLPG